MKINAAQRLMATSIKNFVKDAYDIGYSAAKDGKALNNDEIRDFIDKLRDDGVSAADRKEAHASYQKGYTDYSDQALHDSGHFD